MWHERSEEEQCVRESLRMTKALTKPRARSIFELFGRLNPISTTSARKSEFHYFIYTIITYFRC